MTWTLVSASSETVLVARDIGFLVAMVFMSRLLVPDCRLEIDLEVGCSSQLFSVASRFY